MPRSEYDWEPFLGRGPGVIDEVMVGSKLAGKTVVITGAGGFIGSALARALTAYKPAHLILLDVAEHGLHDLESAFALSGAAKPSYELVVGDVCDTLLLARLFARSSPHIIFHAAALKHVWLMETNPVAAARSNILGTQRVLKASNAAGAERFVLVSTDKAVEPLSFMGATKRAAELLVLANRGIVQANALRLGNVLGSTGSVVPMLERQIASGGLLTITDPACTRYLLTIDEVVRHLLCVLLIDEPGTVVITRTGPPQRIVDLARFLVEHAGKNFEEIGLAYSGLRPGEKLEEAMLSMDERGSSSSFGEMQIVSSKDQQALSQLSMGRLDAAVAQHDVQGLLSAMAEILPDYQPSGALTTYLATLAGETSA